MIRALAHEWRLVLVALQYFTRLPVPALQHFDARWLSQSVRYFPLAGLVVGLASALVLLAASALLPWPVAALLALATSLWMTGAFHEDGLADTFDALGGHVPRERALAIMRDSRIGSYGAVALVLSLALRWQVLVALQPDEAVVYLVCAHPLARAMAAALMASLPYVRLDDDAKAKPVAQPMTVGLAAVTLVIGLAPALVVAGVYPSWIFALACGTAAAAAVHGLSRAWFHRRLGGYTGDALGCAEQFGEIVFGLALLAALRYAG
ncbi:adenosylcobinamide-GDP ribazoletransferase [Lysobacter korlensis]|uniref:Adenosylcobinamide-GDP ribazoletransferase n=1 Tax=Lysobacter korlensis TaxID=553636 RepID=A0ABV6RS07_9GAMM